MASLLDRLIFDELYGSRILSLLLCTLGNIESPVINPTITAYLVPYIREGYDNKKMLLGLKVEHISYTMGTHGTCAHGITITYALTFLLSEV